MRFFEGLQFTGKLLRGHFSLVADEEVISLVPTSLPLLRFCILLWKVDHNQILHGKTECLGSKVQSEYRALGRVGREPIEFEWNIFPGFTTLQLCKKVQEFMKMTEKPSYFPWQIIFMSMLNDISWRSQDNEEQCELNAILVSIMREDSHQDDGDFPAQDQQRSAILLMIANQKDNGQSRGIDDDKIWRRRTSSLPFHESSVTKNVQKQRWWEMINTLLL